MENLDLTDVLWQARSVPTEKTPDNMIYNTGFTPQKLYVPVKMRKSVISLLSHIEGIITFGAFSRTLTVAWLAQPL